MKKSVNGLTEKEAKKNLEKYGFTTFFGTQAFGGVTGKFMENYIKKKQNPKSIKRK